jgi:hypothetical protein
VSRIELLLLAIASVLLLVVFILAAINFFP